MDYNLLNQYGIFILVIIFICINIYYKNIINILIFILSYLALRNMMGDNNALILSYIISLIYGIVKNFHLLENFKAYVIKNNSETTTNNNSETTTNNNSETTTNNNSETTTTNNNSETSTTTNNNDKLTNTNNDKTTTNNDKLTNTNNDKTTTTTNGELFMSDELINQFINKSKDVDNLLVENTKQNIYDLKPTIKNMKKSKINKLKKTMPKKEINKPIVISSDNFIVDGHYRWYIRKILIESNTNGLTENDLYDENVEVIKINYDIKLLLKKLKEYKIKYNESYLSNTILDSSTIKDGNTLIKNIKKDVASLEKIYNLINTKIKLV